nr:hypothetical protein [Candidatus Sigynarchaeum springense]
MTRGANQMGGYGSDYDISTDAAVIKKSASSYNIDAGRKYEEPKKIFPSPVNKVLITKAKFPLVIAVDVTGSMREFPKIIFEKLCILYNEVMLFLPETLKESFEISFAAIGDAYSDQAPVQVTDFASGKELDQNIKSLYPEGGGGGQARETYELIAYFYARHCNLVNPLDHPRPLFIFIGDEGFYAKVNREHVRQHVSTEDKLKSDLISEDVFNVLKQKFNVYILRVLYGNPDDEKDIDAKWRKVLGDKHVIIMKDPKRIVDTIIGIVATVVDGFDAFKQRIEVRQTPEQVAQVYSSLDGIENESTLKKYVVAIQALECPKCAAKLKDVPDFAKPVKCEACGYLLVRIT